MAKGKLMNKIKSTSDSILNSTIDNAKEKYEGTVEELKKDPFAIVDIDMIGKIINDPIGTFVDIITDKEFIGNMIGAAIECIPVVGPILSSIFSIFWPQDPKMKAVTVQELDDRLKEFKEEMIKIIDEKIETSQKETWKNICNALFEGYIFKVKQMKKSVIILKREIKDAKGVITDVPEATKERIRVSFLSLLESANEISNFCKKQKFVHEVIEIYMQSILLQCVSTIQLCSFWYQIDLDKYYILGIESTKDEEGIKSIKEEYHDLMVECLSKITPAVYKNIKDKNENLNKYYQDNAHVLLETNPWLYPFPLVVAPLNIPRIPTKLYLRSDTPTINVPLDRKTPFIYRIDGANMLPEQMKEGHNGYRPIPKIDPLTQCHGSMIHLSNTINISLSEIKDVVVRIFGLYPSDMSALVINEKEFNSKGNSKIIDQSITCFPVMYEKPKSFNNEKLYNLMDQRVTKVETSYLESNGGRSGFTYMEKFIMVDTICLEISQISDDERVKGCVKFIELIITDPTKKEIEDLEAKEKRTKEIYNRLNELAAKDDLTKEEDEEEKNLYKELGYKIDNTPYDVV